MNLSQNTMLGKPALDHLGRLWMRLAICACLVVIVVTITQIRNRTLLEQSRATTQSVATIDGQRILGERISFLSRLSLTPSASAATELAEALSLFEFVDGQRDRTALSSADRAGDLAGTTRAADMLTHDFIATARALLAEDDRLAKAELTDSVRAKEKALRQTLVQLSTLHAAKNAATLDRQVQVHRQLWIALVLLGSAVTILVLLPAQIGLGGVLRDQRSRIRKLHEKQALMRQMNARLLNQTLEDPVTGLPNSLAAKHLIDIGMAKSDGRLSLVRIDLSQGAGPARPRGESGGQDADLLSRIAILQDERDDDDVLLRLGRCDLALLTRGDPDRVARRLTRALANAASLPQDQQACGCRIGYVVCKPGATANDLLEQSLRALSLSRTRQVDSIVAYDPDLQKADGDMSRLVAELRDCLDRDAVGVDFEQQFKFDGGGLAGLTAVAQWSGATRSCAAADGAKLAEHGGFEKDLDRAVWNAAMRQMTQWAESGIEVPCVSLTASAVTLADPWLVQNLMAQLTSLGLATADIRILVPIATWAGTAAPATMMNVERLRVVGINVLPHDCGSGDVDLSCLASLDPGDVILDPVFVERMVVTQRQPQLRCIVQMLTQFGLRVSARQITDLTTLVAVTDAGCIAGQGPQVAPILTAADLGARLQWKVPDRSAPPENLLRA